MSKYAELIGMTDEQKDSRKANAKVAEAKSTLQGAIISAEKAVARAEQALSDAQSGSPLDPQALYSSQIELNKQNESVAILKDQFNTLFGE
jgi:hypothetical protein